MNIFKIGSHYSRVFLKKNTFDFFFAKNMQKIVCTLGNSEKIKLIWDHFFAENEQKNT